MPAVGLATEKDIALYVPRLTLLPEARGYQLQDNPSYDIRNVRGGAPRSRRDKIGTTAIVDAVWILTRTEYITLKNFYEEFLHTTFRMSLLVDEFTLTEHDVRFVPESFKLTQTTPVSYTVSANLEVQLLPRNTDYDNGFIAIYGSYLDGSDAFLTALAVFANTTLDTYL